MRRTRAIAVGAVLIGIVACGGTPSSVTVEGGRSAAQAPTDVSTPDTSAPPGSGSPAVPVTAALPPFEVGTIAWEDCARSLECGSLAVPMDYAKPTGTTISLHLVRRPAKGKSIGALLVNPGGPGFPGSVLAEQAPLYFSEALIKRFDIIGFDPRGTGQSTPAIDCIDEYDPIFGIDPSADSPDEKQAQIDAARAFVAGCLERSGPDLLAHVTTEEVARDMDQIRRALGLESISYFGFSYGSELGATWATMFPDTVRAAVLDGAVDPADDGFDSSLSQLRGFDQAFAAFLADCANDHDCVFHGGGDPRAAYLELITTLDVSPAPTEPGRIPANNAVLTTAVASAMYSRDRWPELAQALANAESGDGSGLLQLYDDYYRRNPASGEYDDSLEAFLSISCGEVGPRETVEEADAHMDELIAASELLGSEWGGAYTCSFWPVPLRPKVPITGRGAGAIVVVGTTGDPATPLESTERMAEALEDGLLIIVEAEGHTGYVQSECVRGAVDAFLVDLEVPQDGLRCS